MRGTRAVIVMLTMVAAARAEAQRRAAADAPRFALSPCHLDQIDADARCGTYWVFEDRARHAGRRIPLRVIVLPSRSAHPVADPFWVVSPGGPGTTNSEGALFPAWYGWWRDNRDVVLVDLRGTSGPNRLDYTTPGSDEHPGGYLESVFSLPVVTRCRDALSRNADLRFYTTPLVVDDLDEVRAALGYRTVNLWGASWGTRAALFWIKRHPSSVRSVILEGVAPPSFENPLPHARSAQEAVDSIFAGCARQPSCARAYPHPAADLAAVLARLERQPVIVSVPRGDGQRPDTTTLDSYGFADGLRVMTYAARNLPAVPMLLHRASAGDMTPFVEAAIESNSRLDDELRFGFLLSITCTEDVSRISPAAIPGATRGTYLGDARVREQMRACAAWPRGERSRDYGDPIRSNVPAFLLSGAWDPVTP